MPPDGYATVAGVRHDVTRPSTNSIFMTSRYLNHRPDRSPQRHPHALIIDPHMHPATRDHHRVHRAPLAVDQGHGARLQVLGGDRVGRPLATWTHDGHTTDLTGRIIPRYPASLVTLLLLLAWQK